jgi:hypothetical protein
VGKEGKQLNNRNDKPSTSYQHEQALRRIRSLESELNAERRKMKEKETAIKELKRKNEVCELNAKEIIQKYMQTAVRETQAAISLNAETASQLQHRPQRRQRRTWPPPRHLDEILPSCIWYTQADPDQSLPSWATKPQNNTQHSDQQLLLSNNIQ